MSSKRTLLIAALLLALAAAFWLLTDSEPTATAPAELVEEPALAPTPSAAVVVPEEPSPMATAPPPQPRLKSKREGSGDGGKPAAIRSDKAAVVIAAGPGGGGSFLKGFQTKLVCSSPCGDELSSSRVVADASSGFYITLKSESGGNANSAFVKCGASISVLPGRNLKGSLSARADVAGEGTTKAELVQDATAACATSLAEDVNAWLRRHPLP